MNVKCVLSSALMVVDGDYRRESLSSPPDVASLPHYVGHPATKALLDTAGAIFTPGLYSGPDVGESFYFCSLAVPRQGKEFTADEKVGPADLKWGVVIRIA